MSEKSPLPDGWRDRFFAKADLTASYRELDGRDHFFCETLRGRIRALELRLADAWEHLDNAVELAEEVEEDIPNLVRRFLLEIYRFDTALLESPVATQTEVSSFETPPLEREILTLFPEVKHVLDLRRHCEAKLLLHVGECERSAEITRSLIDENPDTVADNLAVYYQNLAAACHGLGMTDEVEKNLENAGYATLMIDGTLNAARSGAELYAFYCFLDDEGRSADWMEFLNRLDCPEPTKDHFLERSALLLDRCLEHARLVTF